MKNIRWFETLKEYRQFIKDEIVVSPIFYEHPFYRGLIDFIIDHRTPVFYYASEEYEYSHFTQYFNFVLIREGYNNRFVHMVFDNPLNLSDLSFEYFCEIANHNEYVASNDTEILTYYRLPDFRSKSLDYPILYDILKNKYSETPAINTLLDLRKNIIADNDVGLSGEQAAGVLAFIKKFKENNSVWCRRWYDDFPKIKTDYYKKRLCLPLLEYDIFLQNYTSINSEELFQKNVLENIRTGLAMLGETDLPVTFEGCKIAMKRFEGKVILGDTAKDFYEQYMRSKHQEAVAIEMAK